MKQLKMEFMSLRKMKTHKILFVIFSDDLRYVRISCFVAIE